MKKRAATFEDDIKALWDILKGARNPAGLLRVKIREMEEGTFRGTATPDRDVEDFAKQFELSNKPSSLVMLMLKDLRAGLPVKDPEYPAAVGSYAHKRGLKR